ncbi:unnamed protein product [Symbiodinium natans]|uniref:C3H1-type domain-containing protein n=1 Tax=Symbiodinium natans TaxID=878477 RepID=A0A812NWZ7_9DINO|nr:unnamed protein product [Symbiodinium natans]
MQSGSVSRAQTPEGMHIIPTLTVKSPSMDFTDSTTDDGCRTPSERESNHSGEANLPNMKLIFGLMERGLPSLQRGWRTPDPSPTRTGLPKCAAYTEFIEESDEQQPTPRCARGRQLEEKGRSPSPAQQPWLRLQTPSPEPPLPMPALSQEFMNSFMQACAPKAPRSPWADMTDNEEVNEEPAEEVNEATGMQYPLCVSFGSRGHPYSCGPACKYASKGKGCKDGANCDHCHLCKWKKAAAAPRAARGRAPKPNRRGKQGQQAP